MNFLMGKQLGILTMLIMLNLAVNLRQVVAVPRAFCDHNTFMVNECGKYCGDDKSTWCDTSENPHAQLGDRATECETDPNKCKPTWECVTGCKINWNPLDTLKPGEKFDEL